MRVEECDQVTSSMNLRYVVFLACTASLGGLLFGFDIAIITGAGPFITYEFALSDIGLGWAFSSLLFGCVSSDASSREGWPIAWAVRGCSSSWQRCSLSRRLLRPWRQLLRSSSQRGLGGLAVGGVSLLSPCMSQRSLRLPFEGDWEPCIKCPSCLESLCLIP